MSAGFNDVVRRRGARHRVAGRARGASRVPKRRSSASTTASTGTIRTTGSTCTIPRSTGASSTQCSRAVPAWRSTRTSTTGSAASTPKRPREFATFRTSSISRRFRATTKRFDGPRLELLFPRRLCTERGFRALVEAFDLLFPRHPALELHLCGSGPPEDEAIARAFMARHPHRVRWSQLDMDEMPAAYAVEPCRAGAHGIRGRHVAVLHRGDGDEQRDRDHGGRWPAEPRHRWLQRNHRGAGCDGPGGGHRAARRGSRARRAARAARAVGGAGLRTRALVRPMVVAAGRVPALARRNPRRPLRRYRPIPIGASCGRSATRASAMRRSCARRPRRGTARLARFGA